MRRRTLSLPRLLVLALIIALAVIPGLAALPLAAAHTGLGLSTTATTIAAQADLPEVSLPATRRKRVSLLRLAGKMRTQIVNVTHWLHLHLHLHELTRSRCAGFVMTTVSRGYATKIVLAIRDRGSTVLPTGHLYAERLCTMRLQLHIDVHALRRPGVANRNGITSDCGSHTLAGRFISYMQRFGRVAGCIMLRGLTFTGAIRNGFCPTQALDVT